MEKRNLFQKIFGKKNSVVYGSTMQMLNSYSPIFSSSDDALYNSPIARSCMDAISRNGAKLNPRVIQDTEESGLKLINNSLQKLISERPNDYMNAYDFYYKMISLMYLDNNAFAWIERTSETDPTPIAIHPIKAGTYKVVEYQKDLFLQFEFKTGTKYTASFVDLIHIKRFFCLNDVLGGNDLPIKALTATQTAVNEGIVNAIKATAGVKGIIKTTQAMLKPDDVKKVRDDFVTDFIDSENSTGIASIDASSTFTPIDLKPTTATSDQMTNLKGQIYDYFGITDKIIKSDYDENQWNAFYESVIEPIAIQLGLEFSYKVLSPKERLEGQKIVFEAHRLQYASNKTKIEIASKLNNYFTKNEIRALFNLPPDPEGDVYLQDLNHINSDIADDYQGGDGTDGKEK